MRKLLLGVALALVAAAPVVHAGDKLDNAKEESHQAWEHTKKAAKDAGQWTGEKAKEGWSATKKGASEVAKKVGEKAKAGWDATKETAQSAWDKAHHDGDADKAHDDTGGKE